MKSKAATVSEYLKDLPPDRRRALTQLRSLIRKIAPDAVETMEYGMPAYILGTILCALASRKNYLAFYCCETKVVEAHRARLGKLNCGKGCIRFQRIEELPLDVVASILKEAVRRRHPQTRH